MRAAEQCTRSALLSLRDIYISRCRTSVTRIISDSPYHSNYLLYLRNPGRCFRSVMAKTESLWRNFNAQAIKTLMPGYNTTAFIQQTELSNFTTSLYLTSYMSMSINCKLVHNTLQYFTAQFRLLLANTMIWSC